MTEKRYYKSNYRIWDRHDNDKGVDTLKRLNDQEDEIVKIKHTIKTMMENERTDMGRSVLQQLWQAIQ